MHLMSLDARENVPSEEIGLLFSESRVVNQNPSDTKSKTKGKVVVEIMSARTTGKKVTLGDVFS